MLWYTTATLQSVTYKNIRNKSNGRIRDESKSQETGNKKNPEVEVKNAWAESILCLCSPQEILFYRVS